MKAGKRHHAKRVLSRLFSRTLTILINTSGVTRNLTTISRRTNTVGMDLKLTRVNMRRKVFFLRLLCRLQPMQVRHDPFLPNVL